MAMDDENGEQNDEELLDEGDFECEEALCEFECTDLIKEDIQPTLGSNPYVKKLVDASDLHIMSESNVRRAYEQGREVGLFHLFFPKTTCVVMNQWLNKKLMMEGKNKKISESDFYGYLGLEMAMSLVQMNDISEYWQSGRFCGHPDFRETMSGNKFALIRGNLMLFNPEQNIPDATKYADPLWHSRSFLENFIKKISQIAVPVGTCALDENTARTKARTRARSYLPNKPDPYGIRFYALVGWKPVYLSGLFDNRSGNYDGRTAPEAFCSVFSELRSTYNLGLANASVVDGKSPSAL